MLNFFLRQQGLAVQPAVFLEGFESTKLLGKYLDQGVNVGDHTGNRNWYSWNLVSSSAES